MRTATREHRDTRGAPRGRENYAVKQPDAFERRVFTRRASMNTRFPAAAKFAAFIVAVVVFIAACGSEDDAEPALGAHVDIGAIDHASAGSGAAAAPQRWRGLQVCSGSTAEGILDTTSEEVTITAYTKTTTRVRLAGVPVGPSPDYSCGVLDYEAVVRSNSSGTQFDGGSAKQACTSSSGRVLVVGNLSGYDSDTRSKVASASLGDWLLKFSLNIQEPAQGDAGALRRAYINCNFELTLM